MNRVGVLVLIALSAAILAAYGAQVAHGPALTDEYVYLAGARHFSRTGSLDARFYEADSILRQGYPHREVHMPGYVIALGSAMALLGGAYWTAVALNAAAFVASALLVYALSRALGFGPRTSWTASALFLVLPAYASYVYWAMAELLLGLLVLLAVYVAARGGHTIRGAILAGVLAGATLVVRESIVFVLPAIVVLLQGARRRLAFGLALAAFFAAVYLPLSHGRAEGGANFWAPVGGGAFGFQAVQAAGHGQIRAALGHLAQRAAMNAADVVDPHTTWTERGFLVVFVMLVGAALAGWPAFDGRQRLYVAALAAAFLALVGVLFSFYVVAQWSGFRYMMFLMPLFLPPAAWAAETGERRRLATYAGLGLFCLALVQTTVPLANAFKTPRLVRAERLAEYLARYVDLRGAQRVILPKGYSYGFQNYPLEVIVSLPAHGGGELRVLERQLWYDYLILPGGHELGEEYRGRARYRLMNGHEAEPPYEIFKRLK